jgi:hypothetical protein
VCRDAQVCRQIFLGVPPNQKMSKKVYKNSNIFIILVSFLTFRCAAKLLFKISVLLAQKG